MKKTVLKLICLMTLLTFVLSLVSCGKTEKVTDKTDGKTEPNQVTDLAESDIKVEDTSAEMESKQQADVTEKGTLLQKGDFQPMSKAELKEAAQKKEPIRYEKVEYFEGTNAKIDETITLSVKVEGLKYKGEMEIGKKSYDALNDRWIVTYQGNLTPEE